jgi:hypothetical protein
MKWGWLTRVGRFLLDAVKTKAATAIAEQITQHDGDPSPGPRCAFCGTPMVALDTAATGWVCLRCASNPERDV